MIRILLAEDDEVMRQYLTRALEKSGYEVVAVDRGTAALPLLETQRFDLLLTDIVMPEMDGIELAQHVAAVAPEMRVMFITGLAAVTLKAGKDVQQAKVLSKPFHLNGPAIVGFALVCLQRRGRCWTLSVFVSS